MNIYHQKMIQLVAEIEQANEETNHVVIVSKELEKEKTKKRKVRKLGKKLILDPSTEAME